MSTAPQVNYETSPEQYRHWTIQVDGQNGAKIGLVA